MAGTTRVPATAVVVRQSGLAPSVRFAAAWAEAGARVVEADDLGELLYRRLSSHWQRPRWLLTGLTDPASGFCIAAAAQPQGLRVVWHGTPDEHADAAALAQQARDSAARPGQWQALPAGWDATSTPLRAWLLVPRTHLRPTPSSPPA